MGKVQCIVVEMFEARLRLASLPTPLSHFRLLCCISNYTKKPYKAIKLTFCFVRVSVKMVKADGIVTTVLKTELKLAIDDWVKVN